MMYNQPMHSTEYIMNSQVTTPTVLINKSKDDGIVITPVKIFKQFTQNISFIKAFSRGITKDFTLNHHAKHSLT